MGYREIVMADRPVSYWRNGESVHLGMTDEMRRSTAINNAGTEPPVVPGLVAGDADGGHLFSGVSGGGLQYFLDDAPLIVPGSGGVMSIEALINITSLSGNPGAIASRWPATWLLRINSTPAIDFYTISGGSAVNITSAAISFGKTCHVIATHDGTNGRIYIKGNLSAGPTSMFAPTTDRSSNFMVGQKSDGDASSIPNGTIDEVAFYNYCLSPAQVLRHAQASLGFFPRSARPLARR